MAHPYAKFSQQKVAHERAKEFTGHARGGAAHSDEAQDRRLVKQMLAEHEKKEMKVEGRLHHKDGYAKGGKVKHRPHVKINILNLKDNPSQGPGGLPPMPAAALGAGAPRPAAPPVLPPGGTPPMMPRGMPPAGMPPMRTGGRVKKLTAGSDSGVSRLERSRNAKALKSGGRIKKAEGGEVKVVKPTVPDYSALGRGENFVKGILESASKSSKKAGGGKVKMTAGAYGGLGRLQKARNAKAARGG